MMQYISPDRHRGMDGSTRHVQVILSRLEERSRDLIWPGILVLIPLLVLGVTGVAADDAVYEIHVKAGELEREGTVVSVEVPDVEEGVSYELVYEDEPPIPVQVQGRTATFVVDGLAAGEERSYRLVASEERRRGVEIHFNDGALAFSNDDVPVLEYQLEAAAPEGHEVDKLFLRGGYLHPVYSPSGHIVTGDYPPDHQHHHGIWSAWAHTEFEGRAPDFWNMGEGTAAVEADRVEKSWSGPVHGGVQASHRFVDYTDTQDRTVLDEEWTVYVYETNVADTPVHLFDLEVTQRNVSGSPLLLPEYRYGGVGFRGNDQWLGEENTEFLTSEGRTREDGHATRARWCHIGGEVDGAQAGIAILGHPENVRFPEPMRIHPDEPFFNFAPQQLGDLSIEPGETHTARYRYVVYDEGPDVELIEQLWEDYAHPPEVSVSAR